MIALHCPEYTHYHHHGHGDLLHSSVLAKPASCYPGCHVTFWPSPGLRPCSSTTVRRALLDLDPAARCYQSRLLRAYSSTPFSPLVGQPPCLLTRLAGIPTRVGQGGRLTYSFLSRTRSGYARLWRTASHWADIQLDYARAIGCQATADLQPVVITTATEKETAAALLKNAGITGEKPLCGLHVCKGLAVDENRWPLDRFIDIAVELMENGYDVILTEPTRKSRLLQKLLLQRKRFLPQNAITTQPVVPLSSISPVVAACAKPPPRLKK